MQHTTLTLLLCWCLVPLFCAGVSLPRGLFAMGQNSISNFKVQLQHSLEGARIRRKRQAGLLTSVSDQGFTADRLRVGSSAPGDLPYLSEFNLTMWTSLQFQERDQVFVGTRRGDLVLLDVTDKDKIAQPVALSVDEIVGRKVKAFSYGDQQWFVVLHSSSARHGIQLYQRMGRGLERRQSISLDGEADMDLITVRGVQYLAVSTYWTKTNQGYSYHGRVTLYHWIRTQFDAVAYRETYGARSLACWELDGALYLSVSQEVNDAGDMLLGSPVYLFNAKDGDSLVLVDKMRTVGPRKVAHFSVAGSHYLIFIGSHDAEIFWWTSDQFLLWQTITGTAGASDVSVLSLRNGEVVLVISLKEEIFFLTLDATGHYVVTFTMQFSSFILESLQFMFDGSDYYALALFAAASNRTLPHPVWKLSMDKYNLPDVTAIDPLIQCLSSLRDMTKQRENELDVVQMDLDRVWLSNMDHVVVANVVVKGSAIATPRSRAIVDEVVVSTRDEVLQTTPSEVRENISSHFAEKGMLANKLESVLVKSKDQEVLGAVFFSNPIALPTLHWRSATGNVLLNGLDVSRLAAQALKKTGYQVFDKQVAANEIYSGSVRSAAIEGIKLNDLVLLTGSYQINGKWQLSDALGYDVFAAKINGIPAANLVTIKSDQEVEELKTFHTMTSRTINVHELINGEDLSELYRKSAMLGTAQYVHSSLQFKSALNVRGNILVHGSADKVDFEALDKQGVKKRIPQNITGHNMFSRGITVLKNVVLDGHLNDVDLAQMATLHGNQMFNGNIDFRSAVGIRRNLWSSVVNDKDLNNVAVTRNKDQFVEGRKHFKSSVSTHNIEASDTIAINGVDVSAEAASVLRHKQGLVEGASPNFKNLVVQGNVTAHEGINDFKVYDIPNKLWLKSHSQVIPVALHAGIPVVTGNDINAKSVNGKDLQADFIHVFGNEILGDNKVFQHDVTVRRNVEVLAGKMFDGADITSLRKEIYSEKLLINNVQGKKRMNSLAIHGNIQVGTVNDMDLHTNFLNLDGDQYFTGDAWLNAEPVIAGDLRARNVTVGMFKGRPFTTFLNNVASVTSVSAEQLKSKTFGQLNADKIVLADLGWIDGVSSPDMNRIVRLDFPQTVPSKKEFVGPVHLGDDSFAPLVNGIDLAELINKVTRTDDEREIAGIKTFNGISVVNQLNVGRISSINVNELAKNVMSKTEDNNMRDIIFFGSDLEMETLFVTAPAMTDGLMLSEAIGTDEDAILNGTTFHLSNISLVGDLFVYGLVNGCDLNEVTNFALKKTGIQEQTLKDFVFEKLQIDKNLNALKNINEVSLEKLKTGLIGDAGHQVVAGDLYIHPGISAQHLFVKGLINSTDPDDLVKDAVTMFSNQGISGYKKLPELETDFMIGTGNVLLTEELNNVDLGELLQHAVWKHSLQLIKGEKIFGELIALNLALHGYLNGLRIPHDVHLASDSETVSADIHFTKDMQIFSDLGAGGQMDDVNIGLFGRLVNLAANETVESYIAFGSNVFVDRLYVDGMINDIVPEMAVSTIQDHHIHGLKLLGSLHAGNVNVQHVNGIDLFELVGNIINRKRKETLTNIQVLTQPIYVHGPLSLTWINGLSLPLLKEKHQQKEADLHADLGFLKKFSAVQDKEITAQVSSSSQISDFAYFILHQVMNIAGVARISVSKMLTSKKLQLMSAWTNHIYCHTSGCCSVDYSYWLSADMDGRISVTRGPQNGRYFPAAAKNTVWTNSSMPQPNWCHLGAEETMIGVLNKDGYFKAQHRITNSSVVTDVATFEDGSTYLVVAYQYDNANGVYGETVVYKSGLDDQWEVHQKIPVYSALSMDLTIQSRSSDVLLALGSGIGTYPDSYLSVYRWNSTIRMFSLLKNIISRYATNVRWVRAGDRTLLAVAGVDRWFEELSECPGVISGGQIDIYQYESNLSWMQTLPVEGVVSMATFEIEGESYLAAVSRQMQSIYILQWRGYSRFEVIQSIYARDVRHVAAYHAEGKVYLAASGAGSSEVLKAVVRGAGGKLTTVTVTTDYRKPKEQGDQPTSSEKFVSTC